MEQKGANLGSPGKFSKFMVKLEKFQAKTNHKFFFANLYLIPHLFSVP